MAIITSLLLLIPSAIAVATASIVSNAGLPTDWCRNGPAPMTKYTAYNNALNTDVKQCSVVTRQDGQKIGWKTNFNISNDDLLMPKSLTMAALSFNPPLVSSIQTIPVEFDYEYSCPANDLEAVVIFGMFLSYAPNTAATYEVVVLLNTYGASKIAGNFVNTVTIGETLCDVYRSEDNTIFTFVVKTPTFDLKADAKLFLNNLPINSNLVDMQYLVYIYGGSKIYRGTEAQFDVLNLSVDLDL
ncbi:uncharacterized protein CCR75_009650 [Bremia lactucae]|uniref:Uncharacterized protein n=1 Tax=Bremia lactucae TaxID=4779 RepID=A0A976FGR7_BRELC|nr:hypothetical protein CCR75_009650 [Bremia lactucae]